MPDADPTPDRPRRSPARGRRPRFALPADHHEERASDRTSERIEAFLDGPAPTRRTRRRHDRPAGVLRARTVVPLEDASTWARALRHEDARIARYGRPATILVVDARCVDAVGRNGHARPGGAEDSAMTPGSIDVAALSAAIREQARETDHVTRAGPARFHVLLPETDEREATILAERMVRAGRDALAGDVVGSGAAAGPSVPMTGAAVGPPGRDAIPTVRVAVASPAGGGSLAEAIRVAWQRLEDGNEG